MTGRKSQRIYRSLLADIASGAYRVGDQFRTINEICGVYDVSIATAMKCMDELERVGLLERRQGSGTYVRALPDSVGGDASTAGVDSESTSDMPQCIDYVMPEDIGARAGTEYLTDLLTYMSKHRGDGELALRLNLFPKSLNLKLPEHIEGWLERRARSGARAFVFRWMPREAQEVAMAGDWRTCVHGHPDSGIELPYVDYDQAQVGLRTASYLVDQGCRRVGLLMRAEWRPGDSVMVNHLMAGLGDRLGAIESCQPNDLDVNAAVKRLLDSGIDALIVRNHAGSWLPVNAHTLRGASGRLLPLVSEWRWHPLVTRIQSVGPSVYEALAETLGELMKSKDHNHAKKLDVELIPPQGVANP